MFTLDHSAHSRNMLGTLCAVRESGSSAKSCSIVYCNRGYHKREILVETRRVHFGLHLYTFLTLWLNHRAAAFRMVGLKQYFRKAHDSPPSCFSESTHNLTISITICKQTTKQCLPAIAKYLVAIIYSRKNREMFFVYRSCIFLTREGVCLQIVIEIVRLCVDPEKQDGGESCALRKYCFNPTILSAAAL